MRINVEENPELLNCINEESIKETHHNTKNFRIIAIDKTGDATKEHVHGGIIIKLHASLYFFNEFKRTLLKSVQYELSQTLDAIKKLENDVLVSCRDIHDEPIYGFRIRIKPEDTENLLYRLSESGLIMAEQAASVIAEPCAVIRREVDHIEMFSTVLLRAINLAKGSWMRWSDGALQVISVVQEVNYKMQEKWLLRTLEAKKVHTSHPRALEISIEALFEWLSQQAYIRGADTSSITHMVKTVYEQITGRPWVDKTNIIYSYSDIFKGEVNQISNRAYFSTRQKKVLAS